MMKINPKTEYIAPLSMNIDTKLTYAFARVAPSTLATLA
jgi:hypothetical protein